MKRLIKFFQFGARRRQLISLSLSAFALFLAVISCWSGVSHGLNRWMPEAIEYENVKVAAAVTDLIYGIRDGYVAHTQVYDALREGGFTIESRFLDRLGTKFPENLSDVELLNRGLKKAAEIQNLRMSTRIITDFKPVEPNDLGQVLFYRWAFKIFGLEIQSFYKLYYALFFISIVLFISAYWRRVEATWAMVIVVGMHSFAQEFLIGGLTPQEVWAVATPYSQRFISVLAILSALHIVLAMFWLRKVGLISFVAIFGQTLILFLVYSMRRSALWEVLWIVLIAAGILALNLLRYSSWGRKRVVPYLPARLAQPMTVWPAAFFLCIFIFVSSIHTSSAHSVFRFSDEFLPQHMSWHSIYLGLSAHPKWQERFGNRYTHENGDIATGDALPIVAAQVWLRDKYGISQNYIISPIWGYKYRTTERIIKEMYFDFILENKRFVLSLHLRHKPSALIKNYVRWNLATLKSLSAAGVVIVVFSLGLFAVAAAYLGSIGYSWAMKQIAGVTLVGAGLAVLPTILVFPSFLTMSDQAMMLNIAGLAISGAGISRVARKYRRIITRDNLAWKS